MPQLHKIIFSLRVCLGWMFLYAGLSHFMTPGWTAKGYLESAQTFNAFYHWLATPSLLPYINAFACWGLVLIGFSLVFGALVRLSSLFGILMMALFYFPVLSFPYANTHYFLFDEHIVYILVLVLLYEAHAGRYWGWDGWSQSCLFWKKTPGLYDLIS